MPRKKKNSSTSKTRSKKTNNVTNTSRQSVDNMKYEIASEFGVNLGANATSRDNGLVGGEMTKRLVEKGKNKKTTNNKSRKKSK